ncbi:hypothetical protein EC844_12950 [Acinetobacter calcoaceticus]|uniref:Uncharacterized protein n=1 Tax=Acinetobacter calcoaceticus TaxID=471 RepID=A0A4R1XBU8_ACICA|nr:hypothetical protein EC844_12950 [Acinetobacter calcoaceticus]
MVFSYTGLLQFKQSKRNGIPNDFSEKTSDQPHGAASDSAIQAWENALDQMIYAFSPALEYEDIEACIYDLDMQVIDAENKTGVIRTKLKRTPKEDFTEQDIADYNARKKQWEQMDAEKRKQGRELFAQHFESLWD